MKTSHTSPFRVGERWSYQTRPGETEATFVVLRAETTESDRTTVHLRLEGLHIVHPGIAAGWSHTFPHLPFAQEFLQQSAPVKIAEGEPIDLSNYWQWRGAWLSGGADIFQMTLAQAADYLENLINNPPSE